MVKTYEFLGLKIVVHDNTIKLKLPDDLKVETKTLTLRMTKKIQKYIDGDGQLKSSILKDVQRLRNLNDLIVCLGLIGNKV